MFDKGAHSRRCDHIVDIGLHGFDRDSVRDLMSGFCMSVGGAWSLIAVILVVSNAKKQFILTYPGQGR
jgi:hypothetical protein